MEALHATPLPFHTLRSHTQTHRRCRFNDSRRYVSLYNIVLSSSSKLRSLLKQVIQHTPTLLPDQLVSITQYHPPLVNPTDPNSPIPRIGPPLAVGHMAVSSGGLKAGGEERKGKAVLVVHTWKDCLWEMGSGRKAEVPAPRELIVSEEGERAEVHEVEDDDDDDDQSVTEGAEDVDSKQNHGPSSDSAHSVPVPPSSGNAPTRSSDEPESAIPPKTTLTPEGTRHLHTYTYLLPSY